MTAGTVTSDPVPLRSRVLEKAGIRHGFFTRRGGVSAGHYASLNCKSATDEPPQHVAENRRRAARALGLPGEALGLVKQVHGTTTLALRTPSAPGREPAADAMATGRPGLALGVLTADCVPILLADPRARIVGAAHAGWKGARDGVVQAVISAMARLGAAPSDMIAATGPSIGFESYEVGPEFPGLFAARHGDVSDYFKPSGRAGHVMFDLEGFVARALAHAGVGVIDRLRRDTYDEEELFFSYRRATHRGERGFGCMLSAIAIADE